VNATVSDLAVGVHLLTAALSVHSRHHEGRGHGEG
jgi:hypothetical protein